MEVEFYREGSGSALVMLPPVLWEPHGRLCRVVSHTTPRTWSPSLPDPLVMDTFLPPSEDEVMAAMRTPEASAGEEVPTVSAPPPV